MSTDLEKIKPNPKLMSKLSEMYPTVTTETKDKELGMTQAELLSMLNEYYKHNDYGILNDVTKWIVEHFNMPSEHAVYSGLYKMANKGIIKSCSLPTAVRMILLCSPSFELDTTVKLNITGHTQFFYISENVVKTYFVKDGVAAEHFLKELFKKGQITKSTYKNKPFLYSPYYKILSGLDIIRDDSTTVYSNLISIDNLESYVRTNDNLLKASYPTNSKRPRTSVSDTINEYISRNVLHFSGTDAEFASKVSAKFNKLVTENYIKSMKYKLRKSTTVSRPAPKSKPVQTNTSKKRTFVLPEVKDYAVKVYPTYEGTQNDLTQEINKKFGTSYTRREISNVLAHKGVTKALKVSEVVSQPATITTQPVTKPIELHTPAQPVIEKQVQKPEKKSLFKQILNAIGDVLSKA